MLPLLLLLLLLLLQMGLLLSGFASLELQRGQIISVASAAGTIMQCFAAAAAAAAAGVEG